MMTLHTRFTHQCPTQGKMSFNFSDIEEEEEEEFDLEQFDETGLLAQASGEKREAAATTATSTKSVSEDATDQTNAAAFDNDADESDGGDWDNVDWEDAEDEEEEEDDDEELPSFPQEGITIHIGRRVGKSNNPDDNDVQREEKKNEEVAAKEQPAKKKPRKATVRVLRNVSFETQQLVLNIRRSHLVCCMIHSQKCSLLCSGGGDISVQDETTELLNTALSLVPQEFHTDPTTNTHTSFIIPTASTVNQFSRWFFQFVNHAGQRRRRAIGRNAAQGARTPSSRKRRRSNDDVNSRMDQSQQTPDTSTLLQRLRHLSPCYDEEPQLFLEQEGVDPIDAVESITSQEKVMLFLVMVRSMGWRARYVTTLPAIPLKLTVDHPLFKESSPPTASLDMKPSASELRDTSGVLQNMIRLMREGNAVASNGKKNKRKKRPKQQKASASKLQGDMIDLVSNGDEEDGKSTKKENIPMDKGVSWIEVLRCKDEKGGGKPTPTKPAAQWMSILPEQESIDEPKLVENILAWMDNEAANASKSSEQVKTKGKKGKLKLDRRSAHQTPKKSPVSYVLAVEHLPTHASDSGDAQGVRFTDVTRRYASTWSRTLSLRGASSKDIKERRGQCVDEWFKSSLKRLNNHFRPTTQSKDPPTKRESKKSPVRSVTKVKGSNGKMVEVLELESSDDEDKKPAAKRADDFDSDDDAIDEKEELDDNTAQEVIPKSKAAFKSHPFYVIPSVLNSKEVLHPDARKRICGVFKGELVYRRSDVSTALKAKKWLYEGRKVKDSELQKPVKKVKARKKPKKQGFQALESYGITESAQDEAIALLDEKKDASEDDNMDNLYGIWQTDSWTPPYVTPSDHIPTNEFKNVEKDLLNPGLTHMEQPRLAGIARKLGIPYAPCMLGFDRHGGRGTPLIRGIVVHDHNVGLIREASIEWESHVVEKERSERRKQVLRKWKRLVVGLLTKERLEREYGDR